MALIKRISRLFQADIHSVLDRIEEPEALLKQSLREMEEMLAQQNKKIHILKSQQEETQRKTKEAESSLKEIESQINLCFDHEEEALVKNLIKRKLQQEKLTQILTNNQKNLDKTVQEQEKAYKENQSHYESMKQKAEILDSTSIKKEPSINNHHTEFYIDEEEVEIAFLQEKQLRDKQKRSSS